MIVAWQFTAWNTQKNKSVPWRRFDLLWLRRGFIWHIRTRLPESYHPYRTERFFNVFQAVACQATIIQPLRD
jgi:hypothetical protein